MYRSETVELKKITLTKFCQEIEKIIKDVVDETSLIDWDEDHITRRLLHLMRVNLNGSQIEDLELRNIFINPFKLKSKKLENSYGDIAIVVKIEYKDGDTIEGVAFLEAKRKYKESGNFDALKWDQLERILSNASHSQLLMYDFKPITDFAPTGLENNRTTSGSNAMLSLPITYMTTAPIQNTLQLRKNNDRLYKLSIPFSYQLAYRYFYGFDLQFDEKMIRAAKGDISEQIKDLYPSYVVFITIQQGQKIADKKNKEKFAVQEPRLDVNTEFFSPIREKD
jgi:hypothetical protein